MSEYLSVALHFAFTTFVTCAMVFFISGAYLMLFKIRYANELFKHPYLKERAFNQYSLSIQMTIVLDYFLRLAFPKSKKWIAANANELLKHVDPQDIPTNIKWPIVGLWGGCLIGMVAMLTVWTLLIIGTTK
ncbi:MAG: hypothetical protein HQ450_16020 [Alcaligenaceae bacterium]|nr:hypothetical protein [Alcaligenaceae bacterium]